MLALTILGSNSAIAAFGRNPTSQLLQTNEDFLLIDCGEGTQMQMSKFKVKKSKINHIFISHLHGDHYFGLVGLISSMALQNRSNDLHLYAPPPLKDIIDLQLKVADATLPFNLLFHGLGEDGVIADLPTLTVSSFKVCHRIDCWGFKFKEKTNLRSIVPSRAKAYEIPPDFYSRLQSGEDYVNAKGTIIPNDQVTVEGPHASQYAYCADTKFDKSIVECVKNSDLIYYETTYLKDRQELAESRYHSTTVDAASVAKAAKAGKLIIGHFSSKYEQLENFLTETKEIFTNTELAIEGTCFKI